MKTALYTPCYLEGLDALGNDRLIRNIRYLEFYMKMKDYMGFQDIWLFDNGSSKKFLDILKIDPTIYIEENPHIERLEGNYGYVYCWRALYFLNNLFEKDYDKIILIDSDGYVLSKRLAKFVKNCNSGWHTLWCNKWQFPEASFSIINRDVWPILKEYTKDNDFMSKNGRCLETDVPFTHVHKEFNSDRYGEDRIPQPKNCDFYSQAPLDIELNFEGELRCQHMKN